MEPGAETYPDDLHLGLCYHPPELPEWKLDLWFGDESARQPDLERQPMMDRRRVRGTADEAKLSFYNRVPDRYGRTAGHQSNPFRLCLNGVK